MATQQVPGLTRTDLQEHDLSVPGHEMIQNRVDIDPDAPAIRHWHPGEEVIYVLEGTLEYHVDGRPPTTVKAGEALMVPAETIHAVRTPARAARQSSQRTSSRKASRSSWSSSEVAA